MHADHRTALRTFPLDVFFFDEFPDATLLNILEIVDNTNMVAGAIAPVKVSQARAGKLTASEAVFQIIFCQGLTILDPAVNAGGRFIVIPTPTAGTGFLFPDIGATKTAVDPAGGDQPCAGKVYPRFLKIFTHLISAVYSYLPIKTICIYHPFWKKRHKDVLSSILLNYND
jgi:hypothetical protein